ncbi:MAG: N-acetylmuramoyl-L-alanine amidase, partial [Sphingopyxis sp.]
MAGWTIKDKSRNKARVIELLLILFACVGFGPANAGTLERVDVDGTELTLHFSSPGGEAAGIVLDGPRRIAVDVAGHAPGSPMLVSNDTVLRVRQGRLAGLGLRLVIDLAQPAILNGLHYSPDGRSLTVSLGSASAAAFAEAAGSGSRSIASPIGGLPSLAMARTAQRRYEVSVPIGRVRSGLALPSIAGPNDPALPLVVIDAG